ncbi:MAG TPA: hypothetical protein VLF93_02160 [Candidatus Saccharimonadales bacterium]|nr:hypothetical protein [Candidatus Saccharimonadales bacterium]
MSAEAPVRPKKKLEVRVVTTHRGDRPDVKPVESLVGKEGVLRLGVPVEIIKTDLSLLGSSMIIRDEMSPKSNPQCHETRAQSCATCPLVNCSLRPCSNPCN